jgi:hypothetical protein
MIKTALKHFILELCVDKIFYEITKNFDMFDRKLVSMKVGDHLQLLCKIEGMQDLHLTKCKIVYKNGNKVVVETYDTDIPMYLFTIDGELKNYSIDPDVDFEAHFKKEPALLRI